MCVIVCLCACVCAHLGVCLCAIVSVCLCAHGHAYLCLCVKMYDHDPLLGRCKSCRFGICVVCAHIRFKKKCISLFSTYKICKSWAGNFCMLVI